MGAVSAPDAVAPGTGPFPFQHLQEVHSHVSPFSSSARPGFWAAGASSLDKRAISATTSLYEIRRPYAFGLTLTLAAVSFLLLEGGDRHGIVPQHHWLPAGLV